MEYAGAPPQEAAQVATPQDNGAEQPQPMVVDSGLPPDQQAAAQLQQQQQHQMVQQHQQLPPEMQAGVQHAVDPSLNGMVHIDPNSLVGVPPGLAPLQSPMQGTDGSSGSNGKFKPIDLESLSPKSRQRVMRNRQAATRSKAKKKQQFQVLKDKKVELATEVEQLEAQVVAAQQRVAQLHAENKTLAESCKCNKE